MGKTFRTYNLDQRLLLPPDMRQWLPEGHLALFLLDVVRLPPHPRSKSRSGRLAVTASRCLHRATVRAVSQQRGRKGITKAAGVPPHSHDATDDAECSLHVRQTESAGESSEPNILRLHRGLNADFSPDQLPVGNHPTDPR
jgi:hypothetical protein